MVLLGAGACHAQVPAGRDELPPLELGHIPLFTTEAEARAGCARDAVVWADPQSGYFYPRWHPKYAHTQGGGLTCMQDALHADYWNINPFANNPERGREFPIDPSLLDFGA
jgi:hypothetical protein